MRRRRHLWRSGPGPVGVEVNDVVVVDRCQNAENCTGRHERARGIWSTRKTSGATTRTESASDLVEHLRHWIDHRSCGAVAPTVSSVTALARRVPR